MDDAIDVITSQLEATTTNNNRFLITSGIMAIGDPCETDPSCCLYLNALPGPWEIEKITETSFKLKSVDMRAYASRREEVVYLSKPIPMNEDVLVACDSNSFRKDSIFNFKETGNLEEEGDHFAWTAIDMVSKSGGMPVSYGSGVVFAGVAEKPLFNTKSVRISQLPDGYVREIWIEM